MLECKVCLENSNGTCYAGTEIKGRIECNFTDKTKVRSIKLRIKCKEYNSWNTSESYTDSDGQLQTRTVQLTGVNYIILYERNLLISATENPVFPKGKHVFLFSYTLPQDIPSTFAGKYGSISYKVKAIIDRPWRFNYEDVLYFKVLSPIDFNQMPRELQNGIAYSAEDTVCSWCCTGGNVSMDVELPKRAFVIAEVIPFKVHIINLSNSNVDGLEVKLVRTITCKVTSPKSESKDRVDNLIQFYQHGVGAHCEHTYNLKLIIPSDLEVPNFVKCTLFSVEYKLRVSAKMPTCTTDLDIKIFDIQMGHVRFVRRENNMPDVAVQAPPPYMPPPFVPTSIPGPGFATTSAPPEYGTGTVPESPPPSYSQIRSRSDLEQRFTI